MAFCISYYFWVLLIPRDGQSNCLGTCNTPEHSLCRSRSTANLSPVFQCVPECPQTLVISEQKWCQKAVRSLDMINDIRKHHPSLQFIFSWAGGISTHKKTQENSQLQVVGCLESLTLEMQLDSSVNWLPFYTLFSDLLSLLLFLLTHRTQQRIAFSWVNKLQH